MLNTPADGALPCVLAPPGTPARLSRCYGEHSKARKTCRILVDDEHRRLPLDLHVWGVDALDPNQGGAPLVCTVDSWVLDSETYDTRTRSQPQPGSVLMLGPYPVGTTGTAVKCLPTSDVADGFDTPTNRTYLGNYFMTTHDDTTVPTGAMLLRASTRLFHIRGMRSPLFESMGLLEEELLQARRALRADANLLPKARTLARLVFYLAMYLYRWGGPGTPYPITNETHSQTPVGSDANPISPKLIGRMVTSSAKEYGS